MSSTVIPPAESCRFSSGIVFCSKIVGALLLLLLRMVVILCPEYNMQHTFNHKRRPHPQWSPRWSQTHLAKPMSGARLDPFVGHGGSTENFILSIPMIHLCSSAPREGASCLVSTDPQSLHFFRWTGMNPHGLFLQPLIEFDFKCTEFR